MTGARVTIPERRPAPGHARAHPRRPPRARSHPVKNVRLLSATGGHAGLGRSIVVAGAIPLRAVGSGALVDHRTGVGAGTLVVSGLPAERVVVLLSGGAVPFSEVSVHHATLEEAYLELTRDAVEYRAHDGTGAAR